jgi:hypothetical protein
MIPVPKIFLFLSLITCAFGQDTIKIRKSISDCSCEISLRDTVFRSAFKITVSHQRTKELLVDSITVITFKTGNPKENYCGILRDSSFYVFVPPAKYDVRVCSPLFQQKEIMGIPVGEGKTVELRIELFENEKPKKRKRKRW